MSSKPDTASREVRQGQAPERTLDKKLTRASLLGKPAFSFVQGRR